MECDHGMLLQVYMEHHHVITMVSVARAGNSTQCSTPCTPDVKCIHGDGIWTEWWHTALQGHLHMQYYHYKLVECSVV